jgi:hypothetical protein
VVQHEEIWKCTNLELVRYLKAMEQVEISDTVIKNNSSHCLWFAIDGRVLSLKPGQNIKL